MGTLELTEKMLQSLDCPIFTVKRHEGQLLAQNELARQTIVDGGNRVGKTEYGAQECIARAMGHRAWLKPIHPMFKTRHKPAVNIRIFGEDLRKGIGQILVPKLEKYMPKFLFSSMKKDSTTGVPIHYECTNGTTIDLLTYEMAVDAMEGWSGHFVWFDEPPPRSIYIANWRGLMDHMGDLLITGTPLKEPWIREELFDNARVTYECEKDMDTLEFTSNKSNNENGRDIVAMTWDITTNLGYGLTKQAIEDFAASLTDDEKQCRLHGKPLHFSGRVFKTFNRATHVKKGVLNPKVPYTFYEALDSHPRTPHAFSFYAVDSRGTIIKFNEIYKKEQPNGAVDAETLAHLVQEKRVKDYLGRGIQPVWTLCEPAAWIDQFEGGSFANKLQLASDYEIVLTPGSKDLIGRILAINEALDAPNGVPKFIILDNCIETINEYEKLVWQEHKGATADKKTPSNKPVDKDDHMVEDDGRAFIKGMVYLEQYAWVNGVPLLAGAEEDESEKKQYVNAITGY